MKDSFDEFDSRHYSVENRLISLAKALSKKLGCDWTQSLKGGDRSMPEVTIEVSKDINDLVGEAGKAIYIETLKEVAFKRKAYSKRKLEDLKKKITFFERKYNASYEEFLSDVPEYRSEDGGRMTSDDRCQG